MTVYFKRGMGAAFLFISTAQFAYADVTAQDVWADWKSYLTSYGYEVTGTESTSGSTLTISDLTMAVPVPDAEGSASFSMSSLVLTGNSDGTVAITMPGNIPLHISGKGDDDDTFDVVITLTQTGNAMIVSGIPTDMVYNYTASQAEVTLGSVTVNGEQLPPGLARMSVTMTNLVSSTQMKLSDVRAYTQRMSADSLSYDAAFSDPESDDMGEFSGSIQDIETQSSSILPLNMDPGDMPAMLEAGFSVDGSLKYASGTSNIHAVGDGEDFAFNSTSQGGAFGMTMSAAHLAYNLSQSGTDITVTTDQLPFPVSVKMSEAAMALDIPLAQSDEEQDFSFSMNLADFTISDMIWGMFDPDAVLPRDPATITADVTGKAKVLVNVMDVEAMENLTAPPGELNALTINKLLVSAAGAMFSATGDFTFDNTNLDSFDGMPAPTGTADLVLTGANGLMDKLIQMGLMSDSDAMGARMMMGMLAVPGDGEDSLKSQIEINAQGHIMANGQRLK